jgi:hypothetical protein
MIYEALRDRVSILKTCPVFECLAPEELSIVAGRAIQEYYTDGCAKYKKWKIIKMQTA